MPGILHGSLEKASFGPSWHSQIGYNRTGASELAYSRSRTMLVQVDDQAVRLVVHTASLAGDSGLADVCANTLVWLPCQGETDLRTAAEALLGALQLAGVGQRPLYLVGHSLGCLLIKRLCLEADRTGRVGLLQHLRSLFFLAPPFAGSRVADLARALGAVTHPSAMLLNSTTLNEYTARQNADFALLQANLRFSWRLIGYSEMHDTTQVRLF